MHLPTIPLASHERQVRPAFRRGLWLAAVVAGHALVLGGGVMGLNPSKPEIKPPTVIGMLVAPPAAAVTPRKTEARPYSPRRSQPKVRPAAKPKPVPLPSAPPAPPSEHALTAPPAAPEAPAAPLEEVAPLTLQAEGRQSASPSAVAPAPGSSAARSAEPLEEPPVELPRTDAAHLSNPAPLYPSASRRFGEQGRVLLDVYILPDGRVGDLKLNQSSGFKRLDAATLEAVRQWRYVPARRGDEAIPYWYVQPLSFSLSR